MLDPTGATVALVALAMVLTAVKQVLCYREAVKFGRHVLDETIKRGGEIDPIQLVRAVNEPFAERAISSIVHNVAGLGRTSRPLLLMGGIQVAEAGAGVAGGEVPVDLALGNVGGVLTVGQFGVKDVHVVDAPVQALAGER